MILIFDFRTCTMADVHVKEITDQSSLVKQENGFTRKCVMSMLSLAVVTNSSNEQYKNSLHFVQLMDDS